MTTAQSEFRWSLADRGILAGLQLLGKLPVPGDVPLGWTLRRMCGPPLERLRTIETRLDPEIKQTERQFLAFGDSLARLSQACDGIVAMGERLFALATGKEQGEESVTGTLQFLEQPFQYVSRFAEDNAGVVARSLQTEKAARRIVEADVSLRQAVQPLVYLRTLFDIESALLAPEVQKMFTALNGEIRTLENRVTTQFGSKFEELHGLRRALREFSRAHGDQRHILGNRAAAQRSALEASFAELQTSMRDNAVRQTGLENITSALAEDVSAMVVAMQAHDMVSQRVAHVQEGLNRLYQKFEKLLNCGLAEARRDLPGFAKIARLQALQARSAGQQLENASETLRSTVGAVISHIQNLDEDCLMLREYGQITSAGTGTIQILLDAIDETSDLVAAAAAAARACYEPLAPLGTVAESITTDIDQTGSQMHRIALNTQLIAVRHGQGTGLEILAENMAYTAAGISTICAQTEGEVHNLLSSLKETLEGFAQIVSGGLAIKQIMDTDGLDRQMQLHGLRDATLQALREVGASVDSARKLALDMKVIQLDRLCRDLLPAIEGALEDAAETAEELCRRIDAGEIAPDVLAELASQYTMESERITHAEVSGDGAPGAVAEPQGGSDLGANVDLF